MKLLLARPSLLVAVARITACTGRPCASASPSRCSTTAPAPLAGTVPFAAAPKGRQRPSGEAIMPSWYT